MQYIAWVMEMEILLRNKVEQEIEVYSTTEFNGCIVLCNDVLNEGTPKNYENLKFMLIYLVFPHS